MLTPILIAATAATVFGYLAFRQLQPDPSREGSHSGWQASRISSARTEFDQAVQDREDAGHRWHVRQRLLGFVPVPNGRPYLNGHLRKRWRVLIFGAFTFTFFEALVNAHLIGETVLLTMVGVVLLAVASSAAGTLAGKIIFEAFFSEENLSTLRPIQAAAAALAMVTLALLALLAFQRMSPRLAGDVVYTLAALTACLAAGAGACLSWAMAIGEANGEWKRFDRRERRLRVLKRWLEAHGVTVKMPATFMETTWIEPARVAVAGQGPDTNATAAPSSPSRSSVESADPANRRKELGLDEDELERRIMLLGKRVGGLVLPAVLIGGLLTLAACGAETSAAPGPKASPGLAPVVCTSLSGAYRLEILVDISGSDDPQEQARLFSVLERSWPTIITLCAPKLRYISPLGIAEELEVVRGPEISIRFPCVVDDRECRGGTGGDPVRLLRARVREEYAAELGEAVTELTLHLRRLAGEVAGRSCVSAMIRRALYHSPVGTTHWLVSDGNAWDCPDVEPDARPTPKGAAVLFLLPRGKDSQAAMLARADALAERFPGLQVIPSWWIVDISQTAPSWLDAPAVFYRAPHSPFVSGSTLSRRGEH